MPPAYSRIWPWVFAALVVLMVYRRFRRNFGRQPVRATRMSVRMVILLALALTLAPAALRGAEYAAAEALGAVAGAALAFWGASRTRFMREGERLFYIPHTYTGIAVSALVLGRIGYRLVELYSTGGLPVPANSTPDAPAAMVKTPLTAGLFFVLIGYYVCYYGRVLWKSKRLSAADLEAAPMPPDSPPEASPGQIKESHGQ
jgi:cytochrome b561